MNHRFVVPEEQAGERLDVFLTALFPNRSRSAIKKLIDDGAVLVAGEQDASDAAKPRKPGYAVREGDRIDLTIPPDVPAEALPEDIPLDILYEDEDVIVVNKPKNMVVHPSPGHNTGTLVNAVLYHCGGSLSGIGGVLRPGIVHRIDKDTTGSVIICKNDASHRAIAEQLAEHSLMRIYHALVIGRLPEEEGTVDRPIGRSPIDRKKMAVVPDLSHGKPAVTHRLSAGDRTHPSDPCAYGFHRSSGPGGPGLRGSGKVPLPSGRAVSARQDSRICPSHDKGANRYGRAPSGIL